MCGICGITGITGKITERELAAMRAMRDGLYRRGPDEEGEHAGEHVCFGFRRLSIVDLAHGQQPMLSEDGRFALVFNGEIYNHPALKTELEAQGIKYKTRADTETVLRLYMRAGESVVDKLSGMFAFAIFDKAEKTVFIARDHFGMKPLYYCLHKGMLYFSSELRTLVQSGVPAELDPQSVKDYLEYGFSHAPYTVFKNIYKLPAGCCLKASVDGDFNPLSFRRYYSLPAGDNGITDENEALERLDELLNASVKGHLLSDVPVGSFLSGGVDSSIVTAIMARHYPSKVKTFSIGFTGSAGKLDESEYAKEVAAHIGTEHTPIMLPAEVLGDTKTLMEALDEPIGDSAILPTKLLSAMAKQEVKVVLTGEGADELFAGYNRYKAAYLSRRISAMPDWARGMAKAFFSRNGKDNFHRAIPSLSGREWIECGKQSPFPAIARLFTPGAKTGLADSVDGWFSTMEHMQGFNGILGTDLRTVLADCLLMKVDKASMSASLEARVPFLDRNLVEFALGLSPELKIRRFKSKVLLRRLARKYIPGGIASRRKHGFCVPWEEWVRQYPADVRDALHDEALTEQNVLDSAAIDASMRNMRDGGREDSGLMFRLAVFVLWHRTLREKKAIS